jgi:hypothetical protein
MAQVFAAGKVAVPAAAAAAPRVPNLSALGPISSIVAPITPNSTPHLPSNPPTPHHNPPTPPLPRPRTAQVPLDGTKISDDTRIRAAIPTLKYLSDNGAKVVVTSHLGRPKSGPEDKFRLTPVVPRLAELLGKPVRKTDDCVGAEPKAAVAAMQNGDVLLLENVRFYPQEEKNDPAFAEVGAWWRVGGRFCGGGLLGRLGVVGVVVGGVVRGFERARRARSQPPHPAP